MTQDQPSWTPEKGLMLKHRELPQKIELLDRRLIGGMAFWEIVEVSSSILDETSWLIHEPCLVEQYIR